MVYQDNINQISASRDIRDRIPLKYIVHEAHIVQHKVHDIKYQISASFNNQISNIWFFGQISDRKCESVVQQRLGP